MDDGLKGIPVLVHPHLKNDPAGKQNQVGIIILADIVNDDVWVSFDDNTQGLYSTDALLALLPVNKIHQHLADNASTVALPDLKALTHIDLLLHSGSAHCQQEALKLARQNQNVQLFCLDTVHNQLDLYQRQHCKR